MSNFTDREIEYLKSQRLGRLATVDQQGEPHISPVGFRYNPELDVIEIGGHNLGKSKKFRDIQRNGSVAFVIDDVLPPWYPRGIEIRGHAEALTGGGETVIAAEGIAPEMIRITPQRIIGWGIDTDPYKRNTRSVNQTNK